MEIRISAGKFKNIRLKVPESASPVRERVKLAVFSIIEDKILNSKCLDLCAGSGNLGLEAISRGAIDITFVESDYEAVNCIKENIEKVTKSNIDINSVTSMKNIKIKLTKDDMTKFVYNDSEHYDIVFFDPPYQQSVRHLAKYLHEIINKSGLIVYFRHKKHPLPADFNPNLSIVDTRHYGITSVDFIQKK